MDRLPVTSSLNQYVPTPTVAAVPTVTVGGEKNPAPASRMYIFVIGLEDAVPTIALTDAGAAGDRDGRLTAIFGTVE